jgi:hypothetical protein
MATPLLVVLVAIGGIDLLPALDPRVPRVRCHQVKGRLDQLVYLAAGLALILGSERIPRTTPSSQNPISMIVRPTASTGCTSTISCGRCRSFHVVHGVGHLASGY